MNSLVNIEREYPRLPGQFCARANTYTVFSARATYQLDKHWNLALNFNSLTDRHCYQTTGRSDDANWYGEQRNFVLTVLGVF